MRTTRWMNSEVGLTGMLAGIIVMTVRMFRRTSLLKRAQLVSAAMLACAIVSAPQAHAYPQYSGDPNGGCIDCHGDFRVTNYIPLGSCLSIGGKAVRRHLRP